MSDVKKIATRDSYGNALKALGEQAENLVVLDADLAGATKTGVFMKAFPDRHIDCGIAEARATKGMPTAIVAKTLKGKGVSYMEDNAGWHGKAPNDEEFAIAMEELTKEGEKLCQM